jgi:iron complex transport system ATP-binding protein
MTLLEARGVSFYYPRGICGVDHVSFAVSPGEIVGVVGPNGAGKTTLLRVCAGLLEPQNGEVFLKGRPLREWPRAARARTLGFLPQGVDPLFSLTVEEVVALGRFPYAGMHGDMRHQNQAVVERCLSLLDVADVRHRDVGELSGGERRRVWLAGMLAQEPEVLLLDEPFGALDMPHAAEIFAHLRRLATVQSLGVCLVTHDLTLAAEYCDRFLLLGRDHRPVVFGDHQSVFCADALSHAYGASMQVGTHPFTGKPLVYAPGNRYAR